MSVPVLVQVWVTALLAVSWWLGALGGSGRARARSRAFAGRVGLPAEAVDAALVRRVVRRQRFVQAGIALGVLAAYQVGDGWLGGGALWVLPYAGLAVGAVTDRLTARPLPPGTPRVAHGTRAGLTAYVPGWLLGLAALAAAGAAALAGLWYTVRVPPAGVDLVSPGAVLRASALPVAGLLVSLALARLAVRPPQAAGSPAELAVDDAFRAQAVRDTLHLSAALSVVTAFFVSSAVTDDAVGGLDGVARQVYAAVPLGVLVALVLVGLAHEVFGGPRHWRRRLAAVR